jgi:hypothetical protein
MKYIKRFNENISYAKSLISKKLEGFDKLKNLLSKNMGYIGKFTEYLMNENIPYEELENLYKELLYLKSKQKPLDISKLKYEKVLDKIQDSKNDLSVNNLLSKFPAEQKNIAKELLKTDYNLLLQTANKDNLQNFVSKISRYKSFDELKNAMKLFGKSSINKKSEIKEYVVKSKYSNIVFENENILIVKISSIEDVKVLGSDTSWCILRDLMWNRYTNGRYQYILYDFSKDTLDPNFKIGFTLNKDYTIYAAHDILDRPATQLNDIVYKNGIKYSELIPKTDVIKITPEIISKLSIKTSIRQLNEYIDNTQDRKLLILIVKKILDTITNKDGKIQRTTTSRNEMFAKIVNKIFSDYEIITFKDLKKIDSRLAMLSLTAYSKPFKNKFIGNDPNFNSPANVVLKSLNYFDNDKLKVEFSNDLTFINFPGKSAWGIIYDELKFSNGWNEKNIKILSDKLNEIFVDINIDSLDLNNYQNNLLIENYILLNYICNTPEKVKNVLSKIKENTKIKLTYFLKMQIDLSKLGYVVFSKISIPYIIKKDYTDANIYLDKNTNDLIEHLNGFKVKIRTSKDNMRNYLNSFPNNKISVILRKFKSNSSKGNIMTSDDGLIVIELF